MALAEREDDALELRHVQRRGGSLARDVRHQDAERVLVDRQEVVIVATDFARRFAMGGEADAGHEERPLRQQRHLDAARDAQLLREALFLGLLLEQVLDARGHRVERLRQLAELVPRFDGDAAGEVAAADALVPSASSWIEPVIERASARPMEKATP